MAWLHKTPVWSSKGMLMEMPILHTTSDFLFRQTDREGDPPRRVTQYHYTTWPDHGTPSHATALWKLFRKVTQSSHKKRPILVHCRSVQHSSSLSPYSHVFCSAGVGRTGTFIAMDHLLEQAKKQNGIDVYACVKSLRESRMHMVQSLVGFSRHSNCLRLSYCLIPGPVSVHSSCCAWSIHCWGHQCLDERIHAELCSNEEGICSVDWKHIQGSDRSWLVSYFRCSCCLIPFRCWIQSVLVWRKKRQVWQDSLRTAERTEMRFCQVFPKEKEIIAMELWTINDVFLLSQRTLDVFEDAIQQENRLHQRCASPSK